MSEGRMVVLEEDGKPLAMEMRGCSLMTLLGVVEGDVLACLEARGMMALRRLIRELDWSAPMIMMAVGALARAGLVRGIQHDLEVVVQLRKPLCGLRESYEGMHNTWHRSCRGRDPQGLHH